MTSADGLSSYFSFATALVAVVNPIGAVPLFIALTEGPAAVERRRVGTTACFTAAHCLGNSHHLWPIGAQPLRDSVGSVSFCCLWGLPCSTPGAGGSPIPAKRSRKHPNGQ